MDIQMLLKNFGLSDKEVAVYMCLIKIGPSPVRIIAEKANINRGTTYDILKSLIAMGIVTYYHKETKQYFVVEPPQRLIAALENRQDKLAEIKREVMDGMPELQAIFERTGNRPTVKYYEGDKGMQQILGDILETMKQSADKMYYVYSSGSVSDRKRLYSAMPDYNKKRMAGKILVRAIAFCNDGETVGLDERKYLPAALAAPKKTTHELIYAGKVAHIGLDEAGNSVGVVIENDPIYQMQKAVFEYAWNQLQ